MRKLVAAIAAVLVLAAPAAAIEKPDVLEVLELKGAVSDAWATRIAKEVEAFNEQSKALLIILDSPGGGVLATQAAYDALSKVKVPVVVWCDNVCASGGLYVAMSPAVKHFAVRDISITGSMGVLLVGAQFHRLLEWVKVDPFVFKSGELKDAGSSSRPMTEADSAYLQSIVDYLAKKFYGVVEKGRPGMAPGILDYLKSAKIVFGAEAVEMGLADSVTDREGAIAKAKELSGSQRVFTREELSKMAKAAERPRSTSWGYEAPSWERDLHTLVEMLDEVRSGASMRFLYMMPHRF